MTIAFYFAYLLGLVAVTIKAGEILRENGVTILHQYFPQNPELAHSVNHLLVTGFYLVNAGVLALLLPASWDPVTKIGVVMLVLAATWFANVFFLTRFRCFLVQPFKAKPARAPVTPVIAAAGEQLRAAAPPELAHMDFGGFTDGLAALMRAVPGLRERAGRSSREQFMGSPAVWNEMVHALYALQKPDSSHAALATHFQASEERRARLLPVIGAVVYDALAAKT